MAPRRPRSRRNLGGPPPPEHLVSADGFVHQLPDTDPGETREWLESLDAVVDRSGGSRARYLLTRLLERASERAVGISGAISTPYLNTIPPEQEPWFPGDEDLERRIRAYVRWNAVAMVDRANHRFEGLGGHLSTYASAAALYEVGFNHFFRGKDDGGYGDQVFFQGHAAPGIYARAYLEGRLSEDQLEAFRREVGGHGLSSYPHPRRMPDFWEFPTVSMGLGPLNAVAQARINRYLLHHQLADTSGAKVWCFVGDGEMDEPESKAGLSIAAREQLDNLIFVVNCNLQRLDGPVRGNGKIIQELEMAFRGAGWNVIKVVWGRGWDALLAADVDGVLVERMNSTVDGEFQKYATESGAYIREHFFGPDPRLRTMVEHLSDQDLERLPRGGHDYRKLYAAYQMAVDHRGSPTVILTKTVKGWTLGSGVEARNATHGVKKLTTKEMRAFRDRLHLPVSDEQLTDQPPYLHPGEDSAEIQYLRSRRARLNGSLPSRRSAAPALPAPAESTFAELKAGTGEKLMASTTTAFARMMRKLLADPNVGPRVVPIIPDEARTFGLDALFSDIKIYAPGGQTYEPVDAGLLLSYRESRDGRILEEGITEAGSMASFTAAGTAYATWSEPLIPFFVFYSMFGFQRVGDLIWSFGDQRGRGFLLGATAGRTTLTGEGLQHCDGQSQLLASAVPNCRSYDPAFAYEVAIIVEDGLLRMYGENPEDCFYYLTLYNENIPMPPMPDGCEAGVIRGLYRYRATQSDGIAAQILASGMMMTAAIEAQSILADQYGVAADVWSATSYKLLREDALDCERWNRLHPTAAPRVPYVSEQLAAGGGPVVAVTDYTTLVPDQISRFVDSPFVTLGPDGYGMSDTRAALRAHFEVDASHIVVATLYQLARSGEIKAEIVEQAVVTFGIDPDSAPPRVG
ncbi:MAG: pyruvate dehydrogenase (acetyl-transferring), homodimeric type [Acidimicrobiia bacterium]|nr:pyruvate dehydrogenase (acetyl-transferring), homodimeric type [Acidimicrobiia bacterium]